MGLLYLYLYLVIVASVLKFDDIVVLMQRPLGCGESWFLSWSRIWRWKQHARLTAWLQMWLFVVVLMVGFVFVTTVVLGKSVWWTKLLLYLVLLIDVVTGLIKWLGLRWQDCCNHIWFIQLAITVERFWQIPSEMGRYWLCWFLNWVSRHVHRLLVTVTKFIQACFVVAGWMDMRQVIASVLLTAVLCR